MQVLAWEMQLNDYPFHYTYPTPDPSLEFMKSKPEENQTSVADPQTIDRVAKKIAEKRGRSAREVTDNDYVEAKLQLSVENSPDSTATQPVISSRASGLKSASDHGEIPAQGGEQKKIHQSPEENTLAEEEIKSGIEQADTEQRKENPEI